MARKDSFEASMKALETIVEKLEDGGASLEEALKLFEEGRRHTRACVAKLNEIERKIQILLEDEKGSPVLRDFEEPPGEDGNDEDEENGGEDGT